MRADPTIETRPAPLKPGDRAPDFTLPAADREGTVSLADYRGRTPLLLGLFRGTYCPFCRRAIIRMGQGWERLRGEPSRADIQEASRSTRINPSGELPAALPVPEASAALSRPEGFEPTATDREDAARPFLQFLGQFLVDREGIIRWTNIECAREGLAGLGRFPTDEELLAAVRALPA